MDRAEIRERLVAFGVRTIRLYPTLKGSAPGEHVAMQLVRSATSVGANYAEAMHARTGAEFVSKACIALSEAAESLHWIQVIIKAELVKETRMADLQREAEELVAILSATVATYKRNNR